MNAGRSMQGDEGNSGSLNRLVIVRNGSFRVNVDQAVARCEGPTSTKKVRSCSLLRPASHAELQAKAASMLAKRRLRFMG
jgi:hypothetical protein